ncbi:uncharacterized protein YjdB [Paenibacillus sp. DS2015]|uniref:DUF5057 domain-containing protein n=1 Tax=Paenibacillus sp. DS2015 TaxID=3373917 RepID=UPI003D1D15C1
MQRTKYFILFIVSVSILFLIVTIPMQERSKVLADTYTYKSKILEITDSGESDFDKIKPSFPNITFETISMKTFVALRTDLDGKYDAIYIGSGSHSTSNPVDVRNINIDENGVREKLKRAHNTTGVANDITHLKLNQIINQYINKGLLVMLHNDLLNQIPNLQKKPSDQRILHDSFIKYDNLATDHPNVFYLSSDDLAMKTTWLIDKLKKTPYTSMLQQRPRLSVTEEPSSSTAYRTGDTIQFKFRTANVSDYASHPLNANLYIGIDSTTKMTNDQLVATAQVTDAGERTIEYIVPPGYSGLLYWKLEITDSLNRAELKDYKSGSIRYVGEKTVVRVLQVMPNDKEQSSLLNPQNMKQSYLNDSNYELKIETLQLSTFNQSGVYTNLNGKYDMLIFGFGDEYSRVSNASPLSSEAANAVQRFINTGQSVMFTHDSLFSNTQVDPTIGNYWKVWRDHFGIVAGQPHENFTNLGAYAENNANRTVKVNEGLLTQYPFDLSKGAGIGDIAITHNQYFTLDLEDEEIIPWFNIESRSTEDPYKRDIFDSWNHFYTYSKGNITFSGTGHTNTQFPDWEQKLFVNTMNRAFIGSNHPPEITVHTPTSGNTVPSHQQIALSYTVNDLDLQDRKVFTDVTLKYNVNGVEKTKAIFTNKEVLSGETVTTALGNPLPEGGQLTIEITARDVKGATSRQTLNINVAKISANLLAERTITSSILNHKVLKNTPVAITYTITPKPIPNVLTAPSANIVIPNVAFHESFPAGLEVKPPSAAIGKTGTLGTGYTLSGTLGNITYSLSTDKTKYTAMPITFTVDVKPTKNGIYTLDHSNLTFTDIGASSPTTVAFPSIVFEAITLINKLSLTDMTLLVERTGKMQPVIEPEDASNKELTWISSRPDIATVDDLGIVQAIAPGQSTITIKAKDGSAQETSATVTVITPDLSIIGPDTVKVHETITLTAKLIAAGEHVTSVQWSYKDSQDIQYAEIKTTEDDWKREIEGKKSGEVTFVVEVITLEGGHYSKEFTVTVTNPILGVHIEGPSSVKVNSSVELKAILEPLDADPEDFTWSLVGAGDSTLAKLEGHGDTATITGRVMGQVTARVQVGGKEATHIVDIGPVLTALRLPDVTLVEGASYSLSGDLRIFPETLTLQEIGSDLRWSSSNANVTIVQSGSQGGDIFAAKKGYATITVFFVSKPSIFTEMTVKVTAPPNSDRY